MKVIIAGGRDFDDFPFLQECMTYTQVLQPDFINDEWYPEATTVLSGKARGADTLGELWAKQWEVSVEEYPAQWDKYGKSAGYRRNVEMAENADILVAFWDGKSKGTKHMIDIALEKGLQIHIFRYG